MSARIDVLDRLAHAPRPSKAEPWGYGYRVARDLDPDTLLWVAQTLTDEKTRVYGYKGRDVFHMPSFPVKAPFVAEVRLRPGVTDNVAHSIEALLVLAAQRQDEARWASTHLGSGRIYGIVDPKDIEACFNPLIETVEILPFDEWQARGFDTQLHLVTLHETQEPIEIDLAAMGDAAFLDLSKRGILDGVHYRGPLGLGLDDFHAIRGHYKNLGRNITDIELETFAQTWSEHCKHRFFAASIDEIEGGLFKDYIKSTTDQILEKKPGFCLSVFHDNAGGIDFGGDHVLAYKVETHNSPSALDPYGGAMTGILGVNRDCLGFGMGAKPIANVFGYCLPHHDDARELYRQKNKAGALPTSDRLAWGVIKGVEEGGNHSGIPTVQGFVYENPHFRGKPLVFCGTLGILPRVVNAPEGQREAVEKRAYPGDYIYVAGNPVGFDGIHGATFSSLELDDHSPATAVQIGDPITQKNLQDVLLMARDRGLYHAITDNGAGGLSSSVGEMAESSGGAEVWLENVPLKYPGLAPWEIWISESQERMLFAVPPDCAREFEALFSRYGVLAARIGRFAADPYLRLCYQGQEIGTLSMDFLHKGTPIRHYTTEISDRVAEAMPDLVRAPHAVPTLEQILGLANFRTRTAIFHRYDHEVQGCVALKPLVGGVSSYASVLRPLWDRPLGAALSQAFLPYLTTTDPYQAGYAAVDLAIRRLIASGSAPDKIAILDNYCWSKPETAERLWQLRETTRGLCEAALDFGAPIISGKDSMYNDFRGYDAQNQEIRIHALPTLLISALGIVEDMQHVTDFAFKNEGDEIALYLGEAPFIARTEIDEALGYVGDAPLPPCPQSYASVYDLIRSGDVMSIEALGMGGIGFALVRAALASGIGARIKIPDRAWHPRLGAFGEFCGGFLATAPMGTHWPDGFVPIGRTGGDVLDLGNDLITLDQARRLYFSGSYGDHS